MLSSWLLFPTFIEFTSGASWLFNFIKISKKPFIDVGRMSPYPEFDILSICQLWSSEIGNDKENLLALCHRTVTKI